MPKQRLTLLAFLAATAVTRTSEKFQLSSGRGLLISVTLANGAATPSFTPRLEWVSPTGKVVVLWTAAAALTADATATYLIYPGTAVGVLTEYEDLPLPNTLQLVLTRNTGNADTTVDADTLD